EPASVIHLEKDIFNGAALGAVAYGLNVALFLLCAPLLWAQRKRSPKYAYSMLAFVCTTFGLATIANGLALYINQLTFIDERNYPGGPAAFAIEQNSITINIVAIAFYLFNQWLQDGLLLYRLYVLSATFRFWTMLVPVLLYVASIVSASLLFAELVHPGDTLWEKSSVNIALTYWCIAVSLNLLITVLIVARLIYMRSKTRTLFGKDHSSPYYLTISAMLIESALVYSAFDLVFIVTYALNSSANFIVFPVVGQVETLAPLLIVWRVAQGRALTKKTVHEMT
ncbi:hypothetical protein PUNSTDRAFT_35722, partial [Punctularia strigosozonata HHB-11173 SS5]|uniref:uncharacterized protein n=1 Tax=Punctularia strigosozonata (strain HHB-11173) TaxID=741275 RepID=UPI0004417803